MKQESMLRMKNGNRESRNTRSRGSKWSKEKEDGLAVDKLITIEEAAKIAVDKVGSGTATDWDLDKDLGTTYWEVKVKNGNQSTSVKINSQTGKYYQPNKMIKKFVEKQELIFLLVMIH